MINYNTVQEVYDRNYCSEKLFKRAFCESLNYTEGVMDFQNSLNAYWVIDNIVSYMPKIVQSYQKHSFDFFIVEICLNKENKGYMEVYTEGYINGEYKEHIYILKQEIPFIDLPTKPDEEFTTYKFYLFLSSLEPIKFICLLPCEY